MSEQSRGRVRVEEGQKRVRVYLGGEVVADGTPELVWEKPYYPTYYFLRDQVRTELLTPTERTLRSPSRGMAQVFDVKGGTKTAEEAAYAYPDSPIEALRDLIAFRWKAMDHWFEEDEEVYVHPRDPHTRVDILASSRRVEVELNGVKMADSSNAMFLFETGLPTRYYLPKTDVRLDLLTPTDTTTSCPYKGTARYWSVEADGETFEDVVWGYDSPLPESQKIAGYVAFYNEGADIIIDGERLERPQTKFS